MRESLTDLRKETFRKVGGGFVVGFLLAMTFSLWIFPLLRDIDTKSKNRITEIVLEQNVELVERLEQLQSDLSEMKASTPNGD